ncbi:MAG: hypothetical protein ACTS2F_15475 [Thainema sp.]
MTIRLKTLRNVLGFGAIATLTLMSSLMITASPMLADRPGTSRPPAASNATARATTNATVYASPNLSSANIVGSIPSGTAVQVFDAIGVSSTMTMYYVDSGVVRGWVRQSDLVFL